MPLPRSGTEWPPKAIAHVWDDIKVWSAWWSGNPDELASTYGATSGSVSNEVRNPAQTNFTTGLGTRLKRMFWGTTPRPQDQSPKLHVPMAADIVDMASTLLFGSRPSFVIGDPNEKSKRQSPGAPKRAFDEDAGTMMPNAKAYETKGRNAGPPSAGGPPGRASDKPGTGSTRPANAPGDGSDAANDPEATEGELGADKIETPEDPAQQRLDELFGKKTIAALQTAARVQAGLGGVYWRVVWDEEVADYPILDVIHPDQAIPEFHWDHLTAVTYWREVHNDKGEIWRHLERHFTITQQKHTRADGETPVRPREDLLDDDKPVLKRRPKIDPATKRQVKNSVTGEGETEETDKPELEKIGMIEHAVYVGDTTSIGMRKTWESMADWPEPVQEAMAPTMKLMFDMLSRIEDPEMPGELIPDMASYGTYRTGLTMLDTGFVPGVENIHRRADPIASQMGQSDFANVPQLMDALDEAYTSWMRDLRLGKARIFTPQAYMENLGPGKGAVFNADQEIYVQVDTLAGTDAMSNGLALEMFQPEIRFEAHERTTVALASLCISKSGYSEQTFGLSGEVAMTATESNARERKTVQTINGKENVWQVALPEICKVMMAVDEMVFSGLPLDDDITVEFAPFATDSELDRANTVSTLMTAKAMSQRTAVRMLHPDWDDDQVDAELLEIDSEAPEPPMIPLGLEAEKAEAELDNLKNPEPPPSPGK